MTLNKKEKVRAQMKSRFYYLFWGTATAAVVAGQLYVGTSYRAMAQSMNRWFDETIDIMTKPLRIPDRGGYYMPMTPPDKSFYEEDMVLR